MSKSKKTVNAGIVGRTLLIMNIVGISILLLFIEVIKDLLPSNIIMLKGIFFSIISLTLNFFGTKYFLNKKYKVIDEISNVVKICFLSLFFVVVIFITCGVGSFNMDKFNKSIVVLPTCNYSEEIKNMIQEKSKYFVSFGPPINFIHAREATDEDIEKLEQDIKSEEEKIDNELRENKASWISTISAYIIFSFIGLILVLCNINKLVTLEVTIKSNNKSDILVGIILISLIMVGIIIFVSQRYNDSSSTDNILTDEQPTEDGVSIAEVLEVGDYVEYIPDSATYSTNVNNTGEWESQDFATESVNWRVLDIDKTTKEVLITTSDVVNGEIYLYGIKGFYGGAAELNNMCKELYSNRSLGATARSMNIEDISISISKNAEHYAYYPKGTIFDEGDEKIEYKGNIYTKIACLYQNTKFYESEFYEYGGGGKEMIDSENNKYREPEVENPVYVTQTSDEYVYIYDDEKILGSHFGWLASPFVKLDEFGPEFGLYMAKSEWYVYLDSMNKSGRDGFGSAGIRPVVVLSSKLKIDDSDIKRDGESSATAWKIKK